jgi:hypothetical protein
MNTQRIPRIVLGASDRADLKDEVLTVTLRKRGKAKPRQIVVA